MRAAPAAPMNVFKWKRLLTERSLKLCRKGDIGMKKMLWLEHLASHQQSSSPSYVAGTEGRFTHNNKWSTAAKEASTMFPRVELADWSQDTLIAFALRQNASLAESFTDKLYKHTHLERQMHGISNWFQKHSKHLFNVAATVQMLTDLPTENKITLTKEAQLWWE